MFALACVVPPAQAFSHASEFQEHDVTKSAEVAQIFQLEFQRGPKVELVRGDVSQSVMFFRANVNGEEVWVLLDNGASNSVLDITLAKKLGLRLVKQSGSIATPTASLATSRAEGVEFDLPTQFRFTAPMFAVDLLPISKRIDRPIGMVLGNDILKHLAYVVDPQYKSLLFMKSGEFNLNPSKHKVERIAFKNAIVEAAINGKPARLMIDLGSNHALTVFEHSWSKFFSSDSSELERTRSVDASGIINSRFVKAGTRLELGSFFSQVRTTKTPYPATDFDGHIGFPFFIDKFIVVDESAGVLTVVDCSPDH